MDSDHTRADGPAIGFDNAKSILRVAYLLTAVDGQIAESEQKLFRKIAQELFGEKFVSPEAMGFFVECDESARKLMTLRSFYTEDREIITAFLEEARSSVSKLSSDNRVLRHAFAIWIGICCADRDYSDVERLAIQSMQAAANAGAFALASALSLAAFVPVPAAAVALAIPAVRKAKGAADKAIADVLRSTFNLAKIPDSFLKTVETHIKKIGSIFDKAEKATSAAAKRNYLDMYEFEVETLKDYIDQK